ncbi:MAG: DUF4124 domain-containing protein [Rhodanobacter sp.]
MRRLLIAAVLLALTPLASAQVYKWTDAGGTVHYSEAPPAQGKNYQKIKTNGTVEPLAPATENTVSESEPDAAPAPAQPLADTPDNRAKLCESLKSNLAALQGKGPVVMQKDGKPVALDNAQRNQQIGAAQTQYQQFCEAK